MYHCNLCGREADVGVVVYLHPHETEHPSERQRNKQHNWRNRIADGPRRYIPEAHAIIPGTCHAVLLVQYSDRGRTASDKSMHLTCFWRATTEPDLTSFVNYCAQISNELAFVRRFCEPIRPDSQQRKLALASLQAIQDRARTAIMRKRSGHVDRVILDRKTDGGLDRLIDRLITMQTP